MKILLLILPALLIGCTTPQTCNDLAYQASTNALNQTVDKLNEHANWIMMKKGNSQLPSMQYTASDESAVGESQDTSGKNSPTDYTGPSSKEAYEETLKNCENKS
jgi:hypothetical protein